MSISVLCVLLNRACSRLIKPLYKMQIKLIILDFDGTLASTEEANMQGYVLALREEGIELDIEEYKRRYFGMRCSPVHLQHPAATLR